MPNLVDTCIAATGRTYPAGYGFALTYLKDSPGVDDLYAMRSAAFLAIPKLAELGNSDGTAFVQAYTDSKNLERGGWAHWLIEAAQAVHSAALAGQKRAIETMRLWEHPGY